MKRFFRVSIVLAMFFCLSVSDSFAERLIILTTNDTHSQVDPTADNKGGILRRKVLIDSIRSAEKNVLLIDAGDIVQGTLYFTLFKGEVETALLDSLKYDAYIMGNHEFDNGMETIAPFFSRMKTERLSANYNLDATPLKGLFKPYIIKEYAGKRIGIMGINLLPKGMIADDKSQGVVYRNSTEVANETAAYLKNVEKADFVIMISHVGYSGGTDDNPSDSKIVPASHDIDLVIGAHSHTTVDPASPKRIPHIMKNASGQDVYVTQTGSQGKNVGYISLDLDKMAISEYKLMKVDSRYDSRANFPALEAYIAPYRAKVDSIMNSPLTYSKKAMAQGSEDILNFVGDAAYDMTRNLCDTEIDFAIMNRGGIRQPMPEGVVSQGLIRAMFPFQNKLVVIRMTGQQLIDAFKVMARRGGDPISKQVKVKYTKSNGSIEIVSATVNGKKVTADKTYAVATIDYLANGGDYMVSMTSCPHLFSDKEDFGDRMLEYLKSQNAKGKKIKASSKARMQQIKN